MSFSDLPLDVLHPILAHLSDRRDWHTCALVNKSFNQASTPLLYQKLDSRVRNDKLYHPSETILHRPELAKYVRCVTETGAVHFTYRHTQPTITADTVHALSFCTNLDSLTWTDDCASIDYVTFSLPYYPSQHNPHLGQHPERAHHAFSQLTEQSEQHPLLSLLSGIKSSKAPLSELVIRSHSDLGSHVWSELSQWTGLAKIAIWCMEGPPRVLQGWAGKELGRALRKLELGRCAGVPPTILISVLSQLPLLQDLLIKGIQAPAVLTILTLLPDLQTLDTEYLNSGSGKIWPRDWPSHLPDPPPQSQNDIFSAASPPPTTPQLPTLRTLTVRTSSIDSMGPNKLFPWIRALSTNPGLESFRLLTFTTNGYPSIPRGFILGMARVHKASLQKWIMPTMQMTLSDIACVCTTFGELEEMGCSTAVVVGDTDSIRDAISPAKNLQTLRLHVQWIPSTASQQRPTNGQYNRRNVHHDSQLSVSPSRPPIYRDTDGTDDTADPDIETNAVPHSNYFRYSGDTGGRGVFGFDQVGLRYASSSNFFRYGVDQSGVWGHNQDNDGDVSEIEDRKELGVQKNGEESMENGIGRGRHRGRWPFTLEHAKDLMLNEGSKLRVVAVGGVVYTGKWVWDGNCKDGEKECRGAARFEVDDFEEE